ncbi:uncharacterized protein HKW66_Vig0139890 [Vigna angularis]|uniref:Uncharacterized protein n=1 Tax=Phaseolus angularis TaxID=3914 RepID=A0A8T0KIF8_PHAAN|nr:uncharacterized protein HKW66_Vig0139890 [Vigna angularis]
MNIVKKEGSQRQRCVSSAVVQIFFSVCNLFHSSGAGESCNVIELSREVMRYFSNIFRWLVPGRSSCCFKSGYVIGLNHLTDVEIDKSFGIGWIVGSSIVVGSFHPFFSGDCFVNRLTTFMIELTYMSARVEMEKKL